MRLSMEISRSKFFSNLLILLFISLLLLHSVDNTWAGQRTNSSVWLEKQETQTKVEEQ